MINFLNALFLFFCAQFATALLIYRFPIGPQICESTLLCNLLDKLALVFYILLLFSSVYSTITSSRFIWIWIFGALGTIIIMRIMFCTLHTSQLLFYAVSLPSLTLIISLIINGPFPLTSDEGCFSLYAFRILRDGRWIPYKYSSIVSYYEFFPLVPYLKAVLQMVTGLDMAYGVHPLLVIYITLLISISIYSLVRCIIVKSPNTEIPLKPSVFAALSPLLFLGSPPLSTIAFIPYTVSSSLVVVTFLTLTKFLYNQRQGYLFILLFLIISGVIAHPIYPICLLISLGVTIILKIFTYVRSEIKKVFLIVSIFTLGYWIYTYVFRIILNYEEGWFTSFINFISGSIEPFSGMHGKPLYVSLVPPEVAFSWSLLPAIASVSILCGILDFKNNKKMDDFKWFSIALGGLGMFLLFIGFCLRMSPSRTTRYFYISYFFLIPISIDIIRQIAFKRRILNLLILVLIITMAITEGIQDPAISPDIYNATTNANKRSWMVAETLATMYLPTIKFYFDTRVDIAFSTIAGNKSDLLLSSSHPDMKVIVLGLDDVGVRCLDGWLGAWFGSKCSEVKGNIERYNYSVVYSDGLYKAFVIIS